MGDRVITNPSGESIPFSGSGGRRLQTSIPVRSHLIKRHLKLYYVIE